MELFNEFIELTQRQKELSKQNEDFNIDFLKFTDKPISSTASEDHIRMMFSFEDREKDLAERISINNDHLEKVNSKILELGKKYRFKTFRINTPYDFVYDLTINSGEIEIIKNYHPK